LARGQRGQESGCHAKNAEKHPQSAKKKANNGVLEASIAAERNSLHCG